MTSSQVAVGVPPVHLQPVALPPGLEELGQLHPEGQAPVGRVEVHQGDTQQVLQVLGVHENKYLASHSGCGLASMVP